jgi:hypothetical protein
MKKRKELNQSKVGDKRIPNARPVTTKPAGEKHNEAEKALRSARLRVMRAPLALLSHSQAHV